MPSSRPAPDPRHPGDERTSDLIRWAAFSCVLVPVVLLWYGTSLAGAAGTALGLAAVTAVCRLLLRQSERGAARMLAEEAAREAGPVQAAEPTQEAREARETVPHASRAHPGGRHQRTAPGPHRGGRHSGGNSPVG